MALVYFVKASEYIKIGYTKSKKGFTQRLRDFSVDCPYQVILQAYIETETVYEAQDIEKKLHDRFAPYLKKGEWYWSEPVELYLRLSDDKGLTYLPRREQKEAAESLKQFVIGGIDA